METYKSTVGTRLRKAIERWGTITDFQKAMKDAGVKGSSYPQVHRYIGDHMTPSVEFLEAAAEVLGVRLTWLVSNEGAMTQQVENLRQVMWTGGDTGWPEETARQLREECVVVAMEDSVRAAFLDLLTELIQAPGLDADTPEEIVRWAKILDTLIWAPVHELYPDSLMPTAAALRYYTLGTILALRHLVQDRSLEGLRARPGGDLDPKDIETIAEALRNSQHKAEGQEKGD